MLFLATQRILVEVDDNPSRSYMARLPYDTLDTSIACIFHMQGYIAFKRTEVVSCLPLFHLFLP